MNGSRIAWRVLHVGFTALPILAGLDKFAHVLTDDWTKYLAPWIERALPLAPETFMGAVGVVEIGAGVLVGFAPRIGGWIVAAWLGGIILDLLALPQYWDVAARDLGLLLGAVALALSSAERRVARAA